MSDPSSAPPTDAALLARAHAALERFGAGRVVLAGGVRLVPLGAGVRNRVLHVRGHGADWILRLGAAGDASLGVDRASEAAAHGAAAAAGLAPAVVHADVATGVLVVERVAADAWTWRRARASAGVQAMARRLRALHALPPPAGVRRCSPAALLAPALAAPVSRPGPVPRERLASLAAATLARFAAGADRAVLCHLDLHHRNVLDVHPPVYVDWEYAAIADPVLDLAGYAAYHDLDAARCAALLAAYDGGVTAGELAAARAYFDVLQALWYDAAAAWHSLAPPRRRGLVARLTA